MSVSSREDRSRWSPARLAFQERAKAKSEEVSAKVRQEMARDRVAHAALAARDKAAAQVRLAEQALDRARPALDAADRELGGVWPGSRCPCWRCEGERHERARQAGA